MGKRYDEVKKLFDGNIVLIGFMGTGKTAIARRMSKLFDLEIVEMDETIQEREGMTISEIFEVKGEEYFRNLETELLRELQARDNVIISCGGGTPLREVNVAEMKKIGTVVLLTATPETILERVSRSNGRPLLEGNKNIAYIEKMLGERRERYLRASDVRVRTDGKSKFRICMDINRALGRLGDNNGRENIRQD